MHLVHIRSEYDYIYSYKYARIYTHTNIYIYTQSLYVYTTQSTEAVENVEYLFIAIAPSFSERVLSLDQIELFNA